MLMFRYTLLISIYVQFNLFSKVHAEELGTKKILLQGSVIFPDFTGELAGCFLATINKLLLKSFLK